MSDYDGTTGDSGASRRSFLQRSALASGALALGGSTIGGVHAQSDEENDDTSGGSDGEDHVLMLYPDAVEHGSAQVVSEEIDWNPWTDDGAEEGNGENDYRTHLARFDYSGSHVAPVFVPGDADVEVDGEVSFGAIEELLQGPDDPIESDDGADGGSDGGNETDGGVGTDMTDGEATLVRVSIESGGVENGGSGETAGNETPEDDGGMPSGDENGGNTSDDENGGNASDEENGDDGLLGR